MKITLAAAFMALAAASTGHGMQLRAPAQSSLYTCAKGPLSRISTLPETPAQCCDGKLQCPQFLSTTTVLKAPHASHT